MQNIKNTQYEDIFFDQKYSLSKLKRDCYDMIVRSRKGEQSGYYQIVEVLESLTFVDNSCDEYKRTLFQVVDEMINLDDTCFDIDKLYNIKKALSGRN